MQIRSPRTILAMSAVVALTAAALAPTAALARGPGSGAGDCDGDCTSEQPQAQQQVRARDGSNDGTPQQTRARDGSAQQSETQANAGGGQAVQARAGNGGNGKGGNGKGNANANANGKGNANDKGNGNANANDKGNGNANANGSGQNQGGQNQNQGAGRGQEDDSPRGPGSCEDCDVEMGTMTAEQVDGLVFMANEEKMAGDVYAAFAELYDLPIFERIAASEARHQMAVDTVLERYGAANPAIELAAGEFSDPDIAALYAQLVDQGSASLEAALAVGVLIEETDIADLEERMVGLEESAPDVYNMYSHLLTASGHHLAAFESQL